MRDNWVYILSNDSMEGLLKIGKTARPPEERARELSTATGVPSPYKVAFKIKVADCNQVESVVHKVMKGRGYHHRKEFFRVPLHIAIAVVKEAALKVESTVDIWLLNTEQDDTFENPRQIPAAPTAPPRAEVWYQQAIKEIDS